MFLLFPKGSTISELIGEGDGPGVIAQASHGERRVKEVLKHRKGEKMDRRRVSGSGGANGRGNVKRPCGVVIECSSSMAIGKSEYELIMVGRIFFISQFISVSEMNFPKINHAISKRSTTKFVVVQRKEQVQITKINKKDQECNPFKLNRMSIEKNPCLSCD